MNERTDGEKVTRETDAERAKRYRDRKLLRRIVTETLSSRSNGEERGRPETDGTFIPSESTPSASRSNNDPEYTITPHTVDPSSLPEIDALLSYYQEKGLWLCRAFFKAAGEMLTSSRWRSKYKSTKFEWFDIPGKDRPEPDFIIEAQNHNGQLLRLAVIELKNWFAPQRLNAERLREKITKKFEKGYGPEWVKLLILTENVIFLDDARDMLVQGNYKIERVDEIPGSHPDGAGVFPLHTVEESEYKWFEARSIEQMKRILEKYFLE